MVILFVAIFIILPFYIGPILHPIPYKPPIYHIDPPYKINAPIISGTLITSTGNLTISNSSLVGPIILQSDAFLTLKDIKVIVPENSQVNTVFEFRNSK